MPTGSWLRVETTTAMPASVWLWETRRRLHEALNVVEALQARLGVTPEPPARSASYTVLCAGWPGVAMPEGEVRP